MVELLYPKADADRCRYGGKAAALARLADRGDNVPPWFVVPAGAFDEGGDMPPQVAAVIVEAAERLGPGPFAVRSSAVDEDGRRRSFAGQFVSFLNVTPDDLPARIADVRRSGGSAQVTAYRRWRPEEAEGADPKALPAVMVQAMVSPDVAGVAFGADPVSGAGGHVLISAVAGLADRLVAGEVDGDTCRVDGQGIVTRDGSPTRLGTITDRQATQVAALVRRLGERAGGPQDVEWAIAGGRLHLLQTRPITTRVDGGQVAIWDNANIVESYAGVTTPMTFSFAHAAYGQVYRRLGRVLGLSEACVAENDQVFGNMLGLVRGRVYYNLINWYRALAQLPGFAATRGYMEQMMGVDRALSDELLGDCGNGKGGRSGIWHHIGEAARLGRVALSLVGARLGLNRKKKAFHRIVDAALAEPEVPLAEQSLDRLAAHYRTLERRLIRRWDAPLVNDLWCMIAVGVLGGLLTRFAGSDADRLRAGLLAGATDIVSAEPAKRIAEMARLAAADRGLVRALTQGPIDDAVTGLGRIPGLADRYRDYLATFGDRCVGELKLESPTLRDDPAPLLRAIGQAAADMSPNAPPVPQVPEGGRPGPLPGASMSRRQRWLVGLVAREARARIRDRENLRFERTRVFGRVRRIVAEIGRRLADADRLDRPEDVFYLTIDEVLGVAEGTTAAETLRPIAVARRRAFDGYRAEPAPPRRFMTRGPAAIAPILPAPGNPDTGHVDDGEQRTGLACGAGVVRGVARVIHDPRQAILRDGDILVAAATDPGWVTLFARAAGVVVERGSVLSHSAIVAREMGLPAVVGVVGATSWLADGDLIEVDGGAGTVTRIADAAERRLAS